MPETPLVLSHDIGAIYYLQKIIECVTTIHLFRGVCVPPNPNCVNPSIAEANFSGYSPRFLYPEYWSEPSVTFQNYYNPSTSTSMMIEKITTEYSYESIPISTPIVSWTCTGFGNDIFGYYIKIGGTTVLMESFQKKGLTATDVLSIKPVITIRGLQKSNGVFQ